MKVIEYCRKAWVHQTTTAATTNAVQFQNRNTKTSTHSMTIGPEGVIDTAGVSGISGMDGTGDGDDGDSTNQCSNPIQHQHQQHHLHHQQYSPSVEM